MYLKPKLLEKAVYPDTDNVERLGLSIDRGMNLLMMWLMHQPSQGFPC